MWFFEVTQSNVAWLYNITLWKSSPGHYDEPCAAVRLQNNLQWNWLNLFPFLHEVCDWADLESRYLNKMMTHNYHGESLTYNLKNHVHSYFNFVRKFQEKWSILELTEKMSLLKTEKIYLPLQWDFQTVVVKFSHFCWGVHCVLTWKILLWFLWTTEQIAALRQIWLMSKQDDLDLSTELII